MDGAAVSLPLDCLLDDLLSDDEASGPDADWPLEPCDEMRPSEAVSDLNASLPLVELDGDEVDPFSD